MRPRQSKQQQQQHKQPLLAEQLWFDEERIEVRVVALAGACYSR
jgi:hypothetical protein